MAHNAPAEKEWVPRSHVVGQRFGTLSRAAANKAKIFAQLIQEEKEELTQQVSRPGVGTAFVEVAFISCKDDRDGRRYVEIMKDLETRGAKGEAFFQLFELYPGTGVKMSKYMLLSCGSPDTFVKLHEDRSPEEVAELVKIVKKYHSTVYTAKATQKMKDLIEEINGRAQNDRNIIALQGHTYTKKVHQIDIAESPAYAFEGGMKLVQKYLTYIKEENLTVRIERVTATDAAGMEKIVAAYGELFSSGHRNSKEQPWRPQIRKSIGEAILLNTPIAFIQKVDDTHCEVVVFDDEATFSADADFAKGNATIEGSFESVESCDIFTYGKTDLKSHMFSGLGKKFTVFPASPKLDNPISDLLKQMKI